MSEIAAKQRTSVTALVLVWLVCGVYLGMNLKRGWVPHDEGTLGQSAERILHGEMPHRDFNDPYTGGLSYLNAAAFRFFGVNLLTLRYVLFAFFLLWVPVVFAIGREFLAPWPAAGITLLAVAWSVPNYAAAVPSWYCLFFAMFGTLAILRYIRQVRMYWLIFAGLASGISFLMKTSGLYFVAGGLLFFVYREQSLSREQGNSQRRAFLYPAFLVLCLAAFVAALMKMVLHPGTVSEFLHFVFPVLAIICMLMARESFPARVGSIARFKLLLKMVTPFVCGFAVPVFLFLSWYWCHAAIRQLTTGLFVFALQRLVYTRILPLDWISEVPAFVLALVLTERVPRHGFRPFVPILKILLAAVMLVSCFFYRLSYLLAFHAIWGGIPVLAVGAIAVLWLLLKKNDLSPLLGQQIALLLSVTVTWSLVQFPFSMPVYFCYVAPLVVLTVAALLSSRTNLAPVNLYLAGAFFVLFAVLIFRPGFLNHMNYGYHSDEQTVPLTLPRAAGLRIPQEDALSYGELIPFVQHLAAGQPILAGPDCPEVYFLSGLRNPTSVFFDFLQEPQEYKQGMQAIIDRPDFIKVAVISDAPDFSILQLKILQPLISSRFPESRKIGQFTVYWRP